MAESAVPIRRTKPQLQLFIPWCVGASRHERLVRNALKRFSSASANPYIRHSREGGNPRTNIPRKNVNRDTTTHVHTASLRHSGGSRNPGEG